eukprot:8694088-Pyramimonas_sp.AAC.1
MNPDKPKEVIDAATQLEQRSACVECLGTNGSSYSVHFTLSVTTLRTSTAFSGDWPGDWQQDCLETPE